MPHTGVTHGPCYEPSNETSKDWRLLVPEAVPADIAILTGRREVNKTLGTKDPEEAKRKFAEVLRNTNVSGRSFGYEPARSMKAAWVVLPLLVQMRPHRASLPTVRRTYCHYQSG